MGRNGPLTKTSRPRPTMDEFARTRPRSQGCFTSLRSPGDAQFTFRIAEVDLLALRDMAAEQKTDLASLVRKAVQALIRLEQSVPRSSQR